MLTRWSRFLLALGLVACLQTVSCGRSNPEDAPPPAPSMPAGWVVKQDVEVPHNKRGDVEYRLEGKIKALRNTIYDVGGKKIQLNVIVARDTTEADRIYRILANLKPPFAFARKGDVLYEFVAGNDALEEVKKGHESLPK